MTRDTQDQSLTYRCACGQADGDQPCCWTGTITDMVVIECMPEHLRGSHDAAGNAGAYPHNGARRLTVSRECAERLVDDDPDWTEIVAGADPLRYADAPERGEE